MKGCILFLALSWPQYFTPSNAPGYEKIINFLLIPKSQKKTKKKSLKKSEPNWTAFL